MHHTLLIFFLLTFSLFSNPADQWVATDAIGRSLPNHEQVGPIRKDKYVGMFYYIWLGHHSKKVFDIEKILKQPKNERVWGPENTFHFWGEPEYGYYHSSDPWVIQKDMQMLSHAGIDFIFIDVTNAFTYLSTVEQICKTLHNMKSNGQKVPKISFCTNKSSGKTMNKLYDEFYSKSLYPSLWFNWQDKPLILGDPQDKVLRKDVKEFFTIKRSWAWSDTKWFADGKDKWPWLDQHPQKYGWSESKEHPEQITVSTAQHPGSSSKHGPVGKSFQNLTSAPVDEYYNSKNTPLGLQFEEQWSRAHQVDPKVVMITQWNEWVAQRFVMKKKGLLHSWKGRYGNHPITMGESYFIDVFSAEFNRDIAPMKGGYNDNYYYQLIHHVRKFKGMEAKLARPSSTTIAIDGQFIEWNNIPTQFTDFKNDTSHRNYIGMDPNVIYTNTSGRNDIVESKVVHDSNNAYFYVKTEQNLTQHNDKNWMLLLMDTDQNRQTGWEGYDLMINKSIESSNSTSLHVWENKSWQFKQNLNYAYSANQLELTVPSKYLNLEKGFDFKWLDNPKHLKDISGSFLDGEAAPDRRFNYRY